MRILFLILCLSVMGLQISCEKTPPPDTQVAKIEKVSEQAEVLRQRERAKNLIIAANVLVAKANELSVDTAVKDDLGTAITLYVESGRLFQEAAGLYSQLAPQFIETQDLENTGKAMQYCLSRVQQIHERLAKL